jgi:hypothetical protein
MIPLLFIIGVLIGWVWDQQNNIKARERTIELQGGIIDNSGDTIRALRRERDMENYRKAKEFDEKLRNPKKENQKIVIDVELNTEQIEREMEKLKKLMGECKHQKTCTFYEIAEDSPNSPK